MRILSIYFLLFFSASSAVAQNQEFNPCEVNFEKLSFVHVRYVLGRNPIVDDYSNDIRDWFAKRGIIHNPNAIIRLYMTSSISEGINSDGTTSYRKDGEYHVTYPGYASNEGIGRDIDALGEVYDRLPEHNCASRSKIKLTALAQRPNTAKVYESSSETKELARLLAVERNMYKIEFPSWYGKLSFVPSSLSENSRLVFEFENMNWNNISDYITSYEPFHIVQNIKRQSYKKFYEIYDRSWKRKSSYISDTKYIQSARYLKLRGQTFTCIETACYQVVDK